ncbi:hypothetical protein EJ05DRAFT_130518 [Pseudovirgaria hyperparasitica]|uniref:Uncharacterized protein n=1 Tax=Pseudovirgaria hyperparasitica TaxID=470096 RepID=A0A6A6VY08_9PEZI|nr:uncharacterized protein EJ05DRAFT_130518 [Pseudovirgaria hyperparasitica]KAF2754696.1 hypothetical protein EJ05DRAFT_130518 [Pseudovirgaria hyperparasitica]
MLALVARNQALASTAPVAKAEAPAAPSTGETPEKPKSIEERAKSAALASPPPSKKAPGSIDDKAEAAAATTISSPMASKGAPEDKAKAELASPPPIKVLECLEDEHVQVHEPLARVGEYLVPLLCSHPYVVQRYDGILSENEESILKIQANPGDPEAVNSMEKLVTELRDILANYEMSYCSSVEEVLHGITAAALAPAWEEKNPKFKFLGAFIEGCRNLRLHAVIYARPGLLLGLLEIYLQAKRVRYARPDMESGTQAHTHDSDGELSFSILSTSHESEKAVVRAADIILCFDSSYSLASRQIQHLMKASARGTTVPLLALVPINSIEHVERCIPREGIDAIRYMLTLLQCAHNLREDFKNVDYYSAKSELCDAEEAGVAISTAIGASDGASPDLTFLPALEDITDRFIGESSSDSETSAQSGTLSAQPLPPGKRPHDSDEDSEPKRVRMSEPERRQHISGENASTVPGDKPVLIAADVEDVRMPDATAAPSPPANVAPSVQEETVPLRRLRDYERYHEDLLTRHDELKEQSHELRREVEALKAAALRQKQIDERRTEQDKVKLETIETLRKQLSDATNTLKSSTDSAKAEVATLRNEHAALAASLKKAESSSASDKNVAEYLRDQYEAARQAATQESQTSAALQAENAQLTARLEVVTQDARRKSAETRANMYLAELKAQQQEVRALQALLVRKEEEIRKLQSGRSGMGTRNGSVPRSPMVGANQGSRGNSPMPSGVGRVNALRNG